ncbi:hypothetical protein HYQ46_005447 [Verticillium longisporum]|nr:hypothetical protein HYQ46_005447 [Verticillium longisporum]
MRLKVRWPVCCQYMRPARLAGTMAAESSLQGAKLEKAALNRLSISDTSNSDEDGLCPARLWALCLCLISLLCEVEEAALL